MSSSAAGPWVPGEDAEDLGKPPDSVLKMFEEKGKHGIIVNGLLAWIMATKESVAVGIWKQVVEHHFDEDEIFEARNLLISTVPELKEQMPDMKRTRKSMPLAMKDICDCMEYMTDKTDMMPLVMATSGQWLECPKNMGSAEPAATLSEMASKVKSLEDVMGKFMNTSVKQMETLTDFVKNTSEKVKDTTNSASEKEKVQEVAVVEKSYATVLNKHVPQNQTLPGMKEIFQNIIQNKKEKPKHKNTNIFHGNNQSNNDETSLAADVDLVAFGVSLNVEPNNLEEFLKARGLKVKKVELMTRPELIKENKVRSKSMKVTVIASEYEKAMSPDMWPFRVGVRHFKAPPRRRDQSDGLQSQEEASGGSGQGQGQKPPGGQQQAFPPGSREYGQRKRRNQYQDIGGWQTPRGAATVENLQQMLSELLSRP